MEQTALKTELTDQEMAELLGRVKAADGSKPAENEQVLCDEFGFPFEPEGMYNNAPLEFEETAKALWVVLCNLNYAAARYNRLSPYFPMLMYRLEKIIRQMGSYCITKTVLEQSGEQFPELEQINILELYKMVSVMFRKCCGAYNDLQSNDNAQDMNMVGWLFRWAALAERLKATQERIGKIENGEIKIEQLLKRETAYRDEPKRQRDSSHRRVGPRVRASSLPVLKSFAREVKAHKRAVEKHEQAVQREAEREKRRLEREERHLLSELGVHPYRPMPVPKRPAYETAAGDQPPAGDLRSGPSAESRKKLREKRKKRK